MSLRVCLATSTGGYDHARTLDTVLAQALDVRGAEVEMLLCDAALPACQMTKMGRIPPEAMAAGAPIPFCGKCYGQGREAYAPLGYPVQTFSAYIKSEEAAEAARIAATVPLAEIRRYAYDGLPVGDHAHAGALRYFARGELLGEPHGEAVLRRYFEAGLRAIFSIRRLIAERKYDVMVIHHGIYIPQGMLVEVARSMGVRVVTYNPAYRKHAFVFSHGQSYHFTMLDEPAEHWTGLDPDAIRDEVARYLASRRFGTNDWIWFHDQPREDIAPVLREIGCTPEKPYVALLTSVVWDAQLHYKANAFPGMMDWLIETVRYWGERQDDLQLVIRVHPAEIRGAVPSRQKAADELRAAFPQLPKNVFVLTPENQASTYALGENANACIIYNTKTGVELAAMGIPVIVAGEAWVRGKGFTQDASDKASYFRLLDALPQTSGMTQNERNRALRYAYHFFFRRMIPLPFIHQIDSAKFRVDNAGKGDLAPGKWPGLDTICTGIMEDKPFIYPAETLKNPFPGEAAPPAVSAPRKKRIVWAYDREHLQHPFIMIGLGTLSQAGHEVIVVASDLAEEKSYRSCDGYSFAKRADAIDCVTRYCRDVMAPRERAWFEKIKKIKKRQRLETFSSRQAATLYVQRKMLTSVRHLSFYIRKLLMGAARWKRDTVDTWTVYLRGCRAVYAAKPDIVISSRPQAAFGALLAARFRRSRFVYFPFELYGDQAAPSSALIAWAERVVAKRADALITQNVARAEIFTIERKARHAPIIVHNYKPARKVKDKGKLHKALNLPGKRVVLYEGLLMESRWLDRLAQASAYLPDDTVMVFLGKEITKWRERHAEILEPLIESGRLVILSSVLHEDILDYVADAEVGVVIYDDSVRNNYFCEPGKLSDYIAAGVPVIAPAFPTIRPVIEEYAIGECFTGHAPEAIAAAVQTVLRRGKASYADALAKAACELTWETQAPVFLKAVTG